MTRLLGLFLLLMAAALPAQTHYYVDNAVGSSGDGLSRANAKKQVYEVFSLLGPGDIVHVYAGTYTEPTSGNAFTATGTADAPIRFLAEEPGAVLSKTGNGKKPIFFFNGGGYVEISGFNFIATAGGNSEQHVSGIYLDNAVGFVKVRGCYFETNVSYQMGVINVTTTNSLDLVEFTGCIFTINPSASTASWPMLLFRDEIGLVKFNYNTVEGLDEFTWSTYNVILHDAAGLSSTTPFEIKNNIIDDITGDGTSALFYLESWDDAKSDIGNNSITNYSPIAIGAGSDYTAGDEGTVYSVVPTWANRGAHLYQYTLDVSSELARRSTHGTALGAVPPFAIRIGGK